MSTARKSFLVSLMFHTLMGSLAFFVLTRIHTPPPMMKIPLKHMTLLSVPDCAPTPKVPKIIEAAATKRPPPPQITPAKALTKQPLLPQKGATPTPPQQSITAPAAPVVSPPAAIERTLPHAQTAEVIPSPPKPSIDLAAEKRSFFASLRSTIQNHLRYPSAARRRGMEGEVGVRFTLMNDGTIGSISVQNGEAIFHTAAKTAVASASGINIPKNLTGSLPIEIVLTLEFNLNNG